VLVEPVERVDDLGDLVAWAAAGFLSDQKHPLKKGIVDSN
jgi:hypothetical protein